jgi:hypothetical protein
VCEVARDGREERRGWWMRGATVRRVELGCATSRYWLTSRRQGGLEPPGI